MDTPLSHQAPQHSSHATGVVGASPEPMLPSLELTIVMPCLNEAETIEVCVTKAMAYLRDSGVSGEVLIADNGSMDGSQALASALGARVVPVATRGYGAAIQGGIHAARGRYIVMGDADDSYDFANLGAFLEKLRAGYSLVMGNRFKGGIAAGAMPPLHRYLGNPVLSFVGRMLFGISVRDFHCGLRGFNTEAIRALNLVATGMEFASEMVVKASLARLRITEVPTTLKPDGRSRAPHLKTWRDGWRHLKFLLVFSPRWLFIAPGLALSTLGLVLAIALASGPVALRENLILDINSFTAACFMLIAGLQILGFGILARYYAAITGMLPSGARTEWIERHISTDVMVRVAALLFVLGLGVFGWATFQWSDVGFGSLTNPRVARSVIAGLTWIVISLQIGFGAFMIDLLRVPLARRSQ